MRYYRIEIGQAPSGNAGAVYTSLVNGVTDQGAPLVEMDIPVLPFAQPAGAAQVVIWGVSLQTISQAADFNGATIKVFGGMQAGLPLANPAQSGLLVSGTVFQAYGNWINENMTLTLVIIPNAGDPDTPSNLVLNWKKGTPLAEALKATLTTAFPANTQTINISPNIVLQQDEIGYHYTITQLALHVQALSKAIIGPKLNGIPYDGVSISLVDKDFVVFDGSVQDGPIEIAFTDLIGQPTWIDFNTIQVNCVMRADISVGKYIKLPPTPVITTAQSSSQFRDKSVFQGNFLVNLVRHVGNSRQPDAAAWITTLNAVPAGNGAASGS